MERILILEDHQPTREWLVEFVQLAFPESERLTERESEVLSLVVKGFSRAEAAIQAQKMGLS